MDPEHDLKSFFFSLFHLRPCVAIRVGFVSYGGGNVAGTPATRLDFDLNDHFAKDDVLSHISPARLGLLV